MKKDDENNGKPATMATSQSATHGAFTKEVSSQTSNEFSAGKA